jgi:ABC-2 type transport system permease protein
VVLGRPSLETLQWTQALERLSPTHLFAEAIIAVLSPTTRALGPIFLEQLEGAVMGTPLPLDQSLLLAWPQTVGLLAATTLLFTIGYVLFQRQEVRA